jgi:hypothetical protein
MQADVRGWVIHGKETIQMKNIKKCYSGILEAVRPTDGKWLLKG